MCLLDPNLWLRCVCDIPGSLTSLWYTFTINQTWSSRLRGRDVYVGLGCSFCRWQVFTIPFCCLISCQWSPGLLRGEQRA